MKYVYLLKAGDNHYKVGVAASVRKRVSDLQTANPNRIDIVACKLVDNAYDLESELHTRLIGWKSGGGKEWFALTHEQVVDLAIELNQSPEVDISQNIRLRDILNGQAEIQKRIEYKLNSVLELANKNVEIRRTQLQAPKQERPKCVMISDDELMTAAILIAKEMGRASTSLLQRKLEIGYGRAARIIERLEEQGIVGPGRGSSPREVLV